MPESAIGFFNDAGGTYFLSRVRNTVEIGMYLGLTGRILRGKELVDWGVASHFIQSEHLEEIKQKVIENP